MPSNETPTLISNDILKMYFASQSGVNPNYSTSSYWGQCNASREHSSASLLRNYVSGAIIFDKGSDEMLNNFLLLLKKSHHPEVKAILPAAYTKFKTSVIAKRKQQEKRKAFLDTQFKILENKKQAIKLSSEDLFMINELMSGVNHYSTVKLKNKLMSLISLKIDRTLNGEMKADDDFGKLVSTFGSYKQRKQLEHFYKRSVQANPVNTAVSKKKRSLFKIKDVWRTVKRATVVAGVALLGYIGIKSEHGMIKNDVKQNPTEINNSLQKKAFVQNNTKKTIDFNKAKANLGLSNETTQKAAVFSQAAAQKEVKKESVVQTQAVRKQEVQKKISVQNKAPVQKKLQTSAKASTQSKTISLEEAYKESHQASVKLHLGEKKFNTLYNALHRLEKDGKIKFGNGTNLDWYAYSYTMYKVITPYSAETRLFEDFLSGKSVDKNAINDLVLKAGRNGKGVKGTGSYSAYDNASSQTQQDYKAKRNAVIKAKNALAVQNSNLSTLKAAANGR